MFCNNCMTLIHPRIIIKILHIAEFVPPIMPSTFFSPQVLAKLACGLNKPNRQTVLPLGSVAELFNSLPISKMWVMPLKK